MMRSILLRNARAFSTVRPLARGPVEMGKDALKTVDEVASKAAIKGLDAGEAAATTIKDTAAKVTGQAQKATGEAQGEAANMTGQVKGKASELAGQAKGKAHELQGQAKEAMK